jgi:hypothetical protein
MNRSKKISIVIPTITGASSKGVIGLLESLRVAFVSAERRLYEFNVTLVLNGPDLPSSETSLVDDRYFSHLSEDFKAPVKVVKVYDEGLVHARHFGFTDNPDADYLCFLDDDVLVGENYINGIQEAASLEVDMATGPIQPLWLEPPVSWVNDCFESSGRGWVSLPGLTLLQFDDEIIEIDPFYVWGANFLVSRRLLVAAQGFHPDAFPKQKIILRGDGETHIARLAKANVLKTLGLKSLAVRHRISPERTIADYFFYRSAIEGISASYLSIRSGESVKLQLSQEVRDALTLANFDVATRKARATIIGFGDSVLPEWTSSFDRLARSIGYAWHSLACAQNSILKDWCQKPTYIRPLTSRKLYPAEGS